MWWEIDWLTYVSNFQQYNGETMESYISMMKMSDFYFSNRLSGIFIVLAHWKISLWINMSLQYEIISWFRDNQSLFLLLLCAKYQKYSKHQFHILWFDQIHNRGSISWSTTRETSTTTTTTRIWIVSTFVHCNDLFLYNSFSGTSIKYLKWNEMQFINDSFLFVKR